MFSANPWAFMVCLTVSMFIYNLPYDEVIKMTFKDALDYSGLVPNVRSE